MSEKQPTLSPQTAPDPAAPNRRGRLTRLANSDAAAWLAGVLAMSTAGWQYVQTVHPGVGPFLDSVQYQTTVATLGVSHPPGYPLYTLLGWLFTRIPFGALGAYGAHGDNLAWRLNLFSAVCAALTVLLTTRLIYRLTQHVGAALLGALTLAGAVRFWYQATYAELYPLYTLLVVASLLLLVAWMQTRRLRTYFAAVFVFALCFTVNVPALMLIPAWLWVVLSVDWRMLTRPRTLLPTLLLVLAAALLYVYVPLRALVFGPPPFCNYCPADAAGLPDFLTGARWRELNLAFGVAPRYWLQRWADSGYELMLQFWPLGVLLGAIGLWELVRKQWRLAGLFGLALLGTWFFVVTYNVVDWADFMTPVLVVYAPLIGVGMWAVWRWALDGSAGWRPTLRLTLRPLLLLLLVATSAGLTYATFRNSRNIEPIVSQRNQMIWHWWARDLLPQLETGAWLIVPPPQTDGFVQTWALRFVAWTEDLAPDLTLIYPPIDEAPPGPPPGYLRYNDVQPQLAQHPVYLIELNDARVQQWALLPLKRPDGWTIGYRVVGERTADGVRPWLPPAEWALIEDQVILP